MGASLKVFGTAALILAFLVLPCFAHDHNRPELNEWFRSLHSKGGAPCCDAGDFDTGSAKRLDDIDWESKDGHYRVRLGGKWIDVPDTAVVPGANRSGAAMVWPFHQNGELVGIRCFMPGALI
jgi:hypothetical protein